MGRLLPGGGQPALALLALTAMAAPWWLGWVSVAPNRLLSARLVPLPGALPVTVAWAAFHLSCLALLALAWRGRVERWAEVVAVLAVLALAATVGLGAAAALPAGSPLARASPAAGAWVALLVLALATATASAARGGTPALPLAAALLGLGAMAVAGVFDSLSLAREAAGRAGELRAALLGHAALAGGSLALALLVAAPLSALALRRPALEAAFLGLASGLQVIPSLALFGLLIAPLAALAAAVPALRSLGLGGIGPAPAVIGISAYLLLPLARGLVAGLRVAPAEVLEAARGQGLSEAGILRSVRLPLGAPVMLAALRLAAVQAVGLAVLAALVGGGGLGSLLFQGIGQLASDLILLGVFPVLALSLLADAGLALLARLIPAA
ncbi:ABC transporter permease subunit [Muricoccus pecuniae]|uniref:ABC transporter permease subunit n=1 Tax=Muricoccus pecuniae TaxID=693023 RepID=UPI0016125164|nr:ABC transporter permease subunit [Roseomonas pecuniae]